MPEENSNEEPEIVVDTDWKSQVEKEKQSAANSDGSEPSQDFVAKDEMEDPTRGLPPANLAMLISTFYSQAMMALGVMENPSTGKKETDLMMAKHFIDTLEMLQEKTKGNTNEEEDKMFDEVLHLLRMAYVGATNG